MCRDAFDDFFDGHAAPSWGRTASTTEELDASFVNSAKVRGLDGDHGVDIGEVDNLEQTSLSRWERCESVRLYGDDSAPARRDESS